MLSQRVFHLEPTVCLIDRAQQVVERGRFLDGPRTIERGAQQVQVTPGKQTDGYDALVHDTLRNLIYIKNASKQLKCLAFRLRIGSPA